MGRQLQPSVASQRAGSYGGVPRQRYGRGGVAAGGKSAKTLENDDLVDFVNGVF